MGPGSLEGVVRRSCRKTKRRQARSHISRAVRELQVGEKDLKEEKMNEASL